MNTTSMQEWMGRNHGAPGVLGFGIYFPGKPSLVESCHPSFVAEALDKAWRAVTETIGVLQLNRFPTARFRFVYTNALVHCERRRDGACLGLFAQKNARVVRAEKCGARRTRAIGRGISRDLTTAARRGSFDSRFVCVSFWHGKE
jgi:hypothetical protein